MVVKLIVANMYTAEKEHGSNNTGMHGGTQLNIYTCTCAMQPKRTHTYCMTTQCTMKVGSLPFVHYFKYPCAQSLFSMCEINIT